MPKRTGCRTGRRLANNCATGNFYDNIQRASKHCSARAHERMMERIAAILKLFGFGMRWPAREEAKPLSDGIQFRALEYSGTGKGRSISAHTRTITQSLLNGLDRPQPIWPDQSSLSTQRAHWPSLLAKPGSTLDWTEPNRTG